MNRVLIALITLTIMFGCHWHSPQPEPQQGAEVYVPAGEFWMGCDRKAEIACLNELIPYHQVYLDAFYIEKYEVTVEQYKACVMAGLCTDRDVTINEACNYGMSEHGNHPINCVDWSQAKAYCEYAGKRLPTEAEWEKAARGTDGRIYPWGNQNASCSYAVKNEGGKNGCGKSWTWPVGSKPAGASPYGAMDMAGNVLEWTADWYDGKYYSSSPNRNPTGPSSGRWRVLRGGSFMSDEYDLRSSHRFPLTPDYSSFYIGFRCARD